LLASIASPALADDLTINSNITTPVTTSQASNGTPGNITINLGAGVTVAASGAAVTLDSNNIVDSQGAIQNNFTGGGAIGVHILGGLTGSFISEGQVASVITVAGNGTGNYGVLLDGASAFTGDITLGTGAGLFVNGANSNGVAIKAPLNGNLTYGAFGILTGEGMNGLLVLAPITGSVSVTFGISVAGTDIYTIDKIDPLTGSAVAVGASVSGGILNAGSAVDGDNVTTSALSSSGTAPTIAIQPSIAGASASDIVIGALSTDTFNPDRSLINRGSVHATDNDPGISTIGIGIGEVGAAAHTVTLAGGIYNRGSILTQSESDNTFASSAASAPTDSTGILIGNGARINVSGLSAEGLLNVGSITASVTGNMPGKGTGVLIQPGAVLSSFTNSGAITGIALSNDLTISSLAAYGVRDLSGTLTTVANNGRLATQVSTLDNNAQLSVALDLSHGSTDQSFTDRGTVVGDVLFGSAANQLVIEGGNATVQGAVRAAGSGTVDVHLSQGGTGGAFRTSSSRLNTLSVGDDGTVEMALNKGSGAAPIISTTGAVTFGTGSKVSLVPSSFLPDSGTYTLIHSGGTLSFADFAAATAQPIPFIFNGSITQNGNDLVLTLQRKTAAELGLSGNLERVYEPLAAAALTDNDFGAALLTLGSAADVRAVVGASVPDIAGGVRSLSIAMTDQATGVIGARERGLVTAPQNTRNEFRFWGQEFYNNVSASGTVDVPGHSGAGQGVALGVEWGDIRTVRYGVGYTFFSSQEVESHPRDTKTNGDWNMLSFYAGWRTGDFFVTPQVNLGQGDFHSRRTIIASTVGRSATANWSSYLAAGGFTTGYIMDVGGFQIIPQIAVDGLYLRESAYNENGAGGIGLSLKQQEQQSVRSFAGVLGQGTYTWDNGNLQPQLLVGWSHEFMTSPATIDGSFEATPGSPFHLVGPTLEPNRIIGGASLAYVFGNWSAGFSYDAAHSSGSLAQSATISLSSRF
jgi:uncharacterized protein YhjY with autotransporter beta-barrel domain